MDDLEIQEQIKLDEGFRPYVYFCSRDIPTGGYGHAFLPHSRISHQIADAFFKEDWDRAVKWYDIFVEKYKLNLSSVRRGVIINMLFQMGLQGVCRFKKMVVCLKMENYEDAADEMLDSQWSRNHKSRSFRLAQMMRTGEV